MRATRILATAFACAVLAACGGGAPTEQNPITAAPQTGPTYTGPAPASADVQSFKVNVWDNLNATNRCGQCHTTNQAPSFVRRDDINLAYSAANTIVNLASPRESRMVTKVAGGHNCWLGSPDACADILTTWISNWAGASSGTQQIVLRAPVLKDPGSSKTLPTDAEAFGSTVWPLTREYCVRCHSADAAVPQAPYIASGDLDVAYAAARSKINLDSPALSRLVVRLRSEFHNCWDDCAANAARMQSAIEELAGRIPVTDVDPTLVASKALTLYDGQVASGGNRYNASVVALYEFKTGSGRTAYDTSGVDPALDLSLSGDVTWLGGWGINLRGGKAQGSTASSRKLHDRIKATGEYSIEAWVVPANVTQEDAYIVGYSGGTTVRNFTLGQTLYSYDFLGRATSTGPNGDPALSTAADDEDLQASLQHVVATFDPVNGRRIYVNGKDTGDLDRATAGTLGDWDDTFAFVLGNEVSGTRPWQGQVRFVAIHNRALTPSQVQTNFDAGVGEKYFLLFSLAHLVDVPQAYLLIEVSQFDEHGYLFEKPTFISLDPNARPGDIPLKGMRLGMNGLELPVGQTWRTLDTRVTDAKYTSRGQILSEVGAVFPLDKGAGNDEFFLSFEQLGARSNVRTEPVGLNPGTPVDLPEAPDIGLRLFDEINATFALVTSVSELQPDVRATFERVRQQLPTNEYIEGFVAAQQVGIAQLAIEYCNALVDDSGLRASYFPGVDFAAGAGAAFGTAAQRNGVIDPLLARIVGQNLASQPDPAAIRNELDGLMVRLASCGGSCPPGRTTTVVKAACAAVLGSAVTAIQ
jgi:hypothetical protein